MLTPADVHYGRAERVRQQRQRTLEAAMAAHLERFVHASTSRFPRRSGSTLPTT